MTETVTARRPGPRGLPPIRWVVVASFVGVDGAEPRCVDYRVRVVPETADAGSATRAAQRVLRQLTDDAITSAEAAALGEIPAEGIPRYVFERASQARLLAKARQLAERRPDKVSEQARNVLERQARTVRRGRPPVRSMAEKLRVLADAERLPNLQTVADAHGMSRAAVRDLVSWARHDADPPLFTAYGPGRRGGELTEHARAMLAEIEQESS